MARPRECRPRTRGAGFVLEAEGGFRLELSVSGYQFPGDISGGDADWLVCSVELRDGDRIRARIENDPFFEGRSLELFRGELRKLLDGISDAAVLDGVEEMVTLEIERRDGRFSLAAAITNHGDLDVEVDGVALDAAVLEQLVADLDGMLERVPSRPEAVERGLLALPRRPKLGDFLRRRDR